MFIKASRYYGALFAIANEKGKGLALVEEANDAIAVNVGWNRKSYFKMADTNKKTYISAPRQDSWTIQNVITMFSDRETQFN